MICKPCIRRSLERAAGIEPAWPAWKAGTLPLSYARVWSGKVPLARVKSDPAQLAVLENWMRMQKPEELFDGEGRLVPELRELAPSGARRMSANPRANGGLI